MAQVAHRAVAEAGLGQVEAHQQQEGQIADQSAHGHHGDVAPGEKQGGQDDAQRSQTGPDGCGGETVAAVQNGRHHHGYRREQQGGHDDAGEPGRERGGLRAEAGGEQPHQGGCENDTQHHQDGHDQGGEVQQGAADEEGLFPSAFPLPAGVDGRQGGGHEGIAQDGLEKVGKGEGHQIGVGGGGGAEPVGDDHFPDEAEQLDADVDQQQYSGGFNDVFAHKAGRLSRR